MPTGSTSNSNKPALVGTVPNLRSLLEEKKSSIAEVAAKAIRPERLTKMALVAASRDNGLLECTQLSIVRALMDAAELGVDVSGQLGSAYLIPYWNKDIGAKEATFMLGYRGMIELARRSGEISTIEARAVYANDDFTVEYGLNPTIRHTPPPLGDPRGEVIGVYAVASLKDGTTQFEVMDRSEIDKIRQGSKAAGSGPWRDFYGEMARKTVVRRLFKYLPISVDVRVQLAETLEREDERFGLKDIDMEPEAPGEDGTMGFAPRKTERPETAANGPEEEAPQKETEEGKKTKESPAEEVTEAKEEETGEETSGDGIPETEPQPLDEVL